MFVVTWFDGCEKYTVCAGTNVDAWAVYWFVRQAVEHKQVQPREDAWLTIMCNGVYLNPESGSALDPFDEPDRFKVILMEGDKV